MHSNFRHYSSGPSSYPLRVTIGSTVKDVNKPAAVPLVPINYYNESLTQTELGHLQWMLKKDLLGQDMFLIGPPGPMKRRLAMAFAELTKREIEYVCLSRDTTESDLKQRREVLGKTASYIDQSAVNAATNGRLLIIEGIEKAERNVLPLLNNLLENREMNLEDGRHLIAPERYDKLIKEHSTDSLERWKLVRVHEDFRVIALGLPVPLFKGNPLDPPLRSRFQGRSIIPPTSEENVLNALEENAEMSLGFLQCPRRWHRGTMWDSARKPIKIKSVIQSDGTRRFLLEDNISDSSNSGKSFLEGTNKETFKIANVQRLIDDQATGDRLSKFPTTVNTTKKVLSSSPSLDRDPTDYETTIKNDYLEINGNRVWRQNRRLFKSFDQRYSDERDSPFHNSSLCQNIHELLLRNNLRHCNLHPHSAMLHGRSESKREMENMPLNWKQASSWAKGNSYGNGLTDSYSQKKRDSRSRSMSPEVVHVQSSNSLEKETNALCTRIMTWIDKEVKRNKGALPTGFKGKDLRIINELTVGAGTESSGSASSDTNSNLNGNGCLTGSEENLPKIPSSLKKTPSLGNLEKNKKSVTIVEDMEYVKHKKRKKKKPVLKPVEEMDVDREVSETGNNVWGEVKLDDCTVYLMGETKARPVCNIEVPENKDKIQLHIFLPVI
ncbi:unnamed protein product [Allacma fusca]|uniref:ATPase dynein-related AAA domain-containing protein n=1 Tax=Allacma fusca TaxID=39272 RepID=A0A8J2KT73_9HEXA|nr:unnamed protein product [Allacma fusca]